MARPALLGALFPPAGDRHGPLVPMLVSLTLLTGVVDAASYLRLGHVFVANMTGNVVFVGFAIAGAPGLSVASSLIALGSFLVGARVGGIIGARLAPHRGRLLRGAGSLQVLLIAAAFAIAPATGSSPGQGARYAITATLAVAMGIQNAAAQRLAVPELTTTVLTRTITGLADGSTGASATTQARRVIAIAAMLLGALFGALLALEVSIAAALALALGLAVATVIAAHLFSARANTAWSEL